MNMAPQTQLPPSIPQPRALRPVPKPEGAMPQACALLTHKDVAKQLGISTQTLAKWHREGKGPVRIQLARNIARYQAEDVKTYLDGLRSGAER